MIILWLIFSAQHISAVLSIFTYNWLIYHYYYYYFVSKKEGMVEPACTSENDGEMRHVSGRNLLNIGVCPVKVANAGMWFIILYKQAVMYISIFQGIMYESWSKL